MSYTIFVDNDPSKLDSLDVRLQKVDKLKKRLKGELTMEEERELLKILSEEMREVLRLQEMYFQSPGNHHRN